MWCLYVAIPRSPPQRWLRPDQVFFKSLLLIWKESKALCCPVSCSLAPCASRPPLGGSSGRRPLQGKGSVSRSPPSGRVPAPWSSPRPAAPQGLLGESPSAPSSLGHLGQRRLRESIPPGAASPGPPRLGASRTERVGAAPRDTGQPRGGCRGPSLAGQGWVLCCGEGGLAGPAFAQGPPVRSPLSALLGWKWAGLHPPVCCPRGRRSRLWGGAVSRER